MTEKLSNQTLDLKIDQFLQKSLYDSRFVKKINILPYESLPFNEANASIFEHCASMKPLEYVFFYRGDGNGGWKNEHILLKMTAETHQIGTVFQLGAHMSQMISEIGDRTNYLRIKDDNLRDYYQA